LTLLATLNISRTGLTAAYTTVTASDTFVPDSQTFLHVKNVSGSNDTCVIAVLAGDPPGLTISDVSVTVPLTTGDKMIGPLPAQFFADPTTGLATVTHTQTASVTSGVFKLSQP
jgi:hypothetical protein